MSTSLPLSERLTILTSEVLQLETNIQDLSTRLLESDKTAVEFNSRIAQLEARIKELTTPPIITAPTSTIPDVKITFMGQTFSPTGLGELWPLSGERRWAFKVTEEIRLIVDILKTQVRIIVERAWAGIPSNLSSVSIPMVVKIDGKTEWDSPIRIHHRTRHCKTFNRLQRPQYNLLEMKSKGIIPNYSLVSITSLVDIKKDWKWKAWGEAEKDNQAYDRWTEEYGYARGSWASGVPLENEGTPLPSWDVLMLHATEPELVSYLWNQCGKTADSSGNYAIHYMNKLGGGSLRYDDVEAQTLPVLNADNLQALSMADGTPLPKPDIAHDMALCNTMALLTRERFYVEELESWVLLGSLARRGTDRSSGIYWSGQARAFAWWVRNLYHLCLIYADQNSPDSRHFETQLINNLVSLNKRFANPDSPEFLSTGLVSIIDRKETPWTRFSAPSMFQTATGNTHFIAFMLGEIHRSKIVGDFAEPILRCLIKTSKGTWESSPTEYLAGWLQHTIGDNPKVDTWEAICTRTFQNMPSSSTTNFSTSPLTTDIVAWHRASVIQAANLGEQWAIEALEWIDRELRIAKKSPSLSWQIQPQS